MYKSESRKPAFRVIFSMLLLFLIVCLTPQAVLAAKAPKKVTGLKASAASESVTLTWNPITSASGYLVYGKTGTEAFKWMKTLQGANRKKCTLTGLDDGKVYAFRVIAFVQSGGERLKGPNSAIVKATPTTKKPGKPVLSAVAASRSHKVPLSWKKVNGADGYEIYQKNAEGKFVSIGKTKKTSITITKLKNNTFYYFKVRAYVKTASGKLVKGAFSNEITGYPNYSNRKEAKGVHSTYFTAYTTVSVKPSDYNKTIPAGTKVTILYKGSPDCTVQLSNGSKVTMKSWQLNITKNQYNHKATYSQKTAEAYVNFKGYKSKTKYLVWVSLYTQNVYVFEGSQYQWKMKYRWPCSSGRTGHFTGTGVSVMSMRATLTADGRKGFYWADEQHDSWVYWMTYITPFGNGIHSPVHWRAGAPLFNPGTPESRGCVRVEEKNAKWLWNNILYSTCVRY